MKGIRLPQDAISGRPAQAERAALRAALAPFERANGKASAFQLGTTLALFVAICALMYWTFDISYFLTLVLAIPAAGVLVRLFIIQHDCGHGSYFGSRIANNIVGTVCSVLTLTPYVHWRRQHAGHHGNWNNLDRRESGADIYSVCLTAKEYQAMRFWPRLAYRLGRNPILIHLVVPPIVFLALYRVPFDTPAAWHAEKRSVYWTNLLLVGAFVGFGFLLGFGRVAMVQAPIAVLASILGVWLFAVQHRFADTLWARQKDWDFTAASLQGSSYLRLPRLLNWFTGNIGFHHIHHLAPRVPNYRLQDCFDAVPALRAGPSLSLWSALNSVRLALWDEDRSRLIRFRDLRPAPTV